MAAHDIFLRMHRSRLAGFIIDCQTADLESAAGFWSEALGLPLTGDDSGDSGYRHLQNAPGDLYVQIQQVQHPSRVHLDIETDDIEAETRRLEQLGAKRVAVVKTWVVMEAPTGQRFCVVRPESMRFASESNLWNQE
jgi:predicted enzyme related to lactoylglutathione lyase